MTRSRDHDITLSKYDGQNRLISKSDRASNVYLQIEKF